MTERGADPTIGEFLAPFRRASVRDVVEAALFYAVFIEGRRDASVSDLRTLISRARMAAAKANLAGALARSGTHVELTSLTRPYRWRLTATGRREVLARIDGRSPEAEPSPIPLPAGSASPLRRMLDVARDDATGNYLREALTCLEAGALRAAVVFAWVGSIHLLQLRLIATGGDRVRQALLRHDPKVRPIRGVDDFAYVRESQQLLAAEEIGLIDKGQRQVLGEALDLRNRCGHPGKYSPGPARVAATIEDLARIVFLEPKQT